MHGIALLISYKCYAILLASSIIVAFSSYLASGSHYWKDILESLYSTWIFLFWSLVACWEACRFRGRIVAAELSNQPALDLQSERQKLYRNLCFYGHGSMFFVIIWGIVIFIQGSWIHKSLALVAFFLNVGLTILLLYRKKLIQCLFKDIVLVRDDASTLLSENCSICFENQDVEPIVRVPCSHYFHSKCIQTWIEIAPIPTCPLCRRNFLDYLP